MCVVISLWSHVYPKYMNTITIYVTLTSSIPVPGCMYMYMHFSQSQCVGVLRGSSWQLAWSLGMCYSSRPPRYVHKSVVITDVCVSGAGYNIVYDFMLCVMIVLQT